MELDTRVGAYAVIVRDGKVLLTHWVLERDSTQRLTLDTVTSGWTLPGGGLEPGEGPEAAAVREVLEETGYVIELTRLLGTDSLHFRSDQRSPGQPLSAPSARCAWYSSTRTRTHRSGRRSVRSRRRLGAQRRPCAAGCVERRRTKADAGE